MMWMKHDFRMTHL